jgi:hypothetical protein
MTVSFIILTVGILVRATFHRRITKNKLTMKPYYYMVGYFSCIVLKNFVLLTLTENGEFPSLFLAWLYFLLDYVKLCSILLSFGSQCFEWFLLSRMVAFQSNLQDSELMVSRFAYQA